ncbi:transmembrane protease serine 12 [Hyperolius riggenbachi]|uniref:transmembrane protease serine 12 n=1 Tax=Hyperolius riggenbachi TaxID=752182 RepID=UPI0035A35DB9
MGSTVIRVLWWRVMLMASDVQACGQTPLVDTLGSRIIGGRDALPGAWPWQASLQYFITGRGYKHWCGGTLIDDTWVMTAAHCVMERRNPRMWRAVFGVNSIPGSSTMRIISAVIGMRVHANFNKVTMNNDVALMRLASSIKYTDYIQPICLATQELHVDNMTQCFITGWGTTAPGGITSNTLQEAEIDIIPSSVCNRRGWYNGMISDNMICAGYEEGGIDTCQGDSGGPLMCYIPETSRFFQIGITSFGYGCAEAQHPGVYTRVANYGNWMYTQMTSFTYEGGACDSTRPSKVEGTTLHFLSIVTVVTWLMNII